MSQHRKMLFVFVDGIGLGSGDPAVNPIHSGACPCLEQLLQAHASPIDATLGVDGLPQSATGQTTLFTGIDAIRAVGRHVEGFPGSQLKAIIREHNLFKQLAAHGRTSTFANAYFVNDVETVIRHRMHSVTTTATLSAFGAVRCRADLEAGNAVYQDITRATLVSRGYTGPLITPDQAADDLVRIAGDHDFTLFEYFQTDRAGHGADPAAIRSVLSTLDGFLAALLPRCAGAGIGLLLTSDHGNIEDSSTPRHTLNPVPFLAVGPDTEILPAQVHSILDVTPAVLAWLCDTSPAA